jgi:hypothetical protein
MTDLVKQIQSAVLNMMSKVSFDDKKHIYQDKKSENWLQGVSTVSSIIPKDWLSAWGAKEAVKFLGYSDYPEDTSRAEEMLATIELLKTDEEKTKVEKYIELLKEAKGASRRKSKTALVDGKAGHAWLEEYVLAKIRNTEIPEIPTGTLERPLNQFCEWEKENVDYWILAEARVAYPEKGYAGTLDAMAMMKNGRLAVIDFKFASHISEDYYLQTAGYKATFEPYNIKIDDRIIIRLPKTLMIEEWDEKEHKYKMIDNNLEVEIVKTNYELDRDTFFHCLFIKKWINLFKK